MKIYDLIAMCVKNLTRRKFLTFLTVLGVVIGTCEIVVMISLGVGISISNQKMLESFGDLSIIEINNYSMGTDLVLDDAVLSQIKAMPGVSVATPLYRLESMPYGITAGKKGRYNLMWADFVGVYPEALNLLGYEIKEGQLLSESTGKKIQIVMGEYAAYQFEDTKKRWPNSYIDIWNFLYGEQKGTTIPDPFFDPLTEPLTLIVPPQDPEKNKPLTFELEVVGILKGNQGKGNETIQGIFVSVEDLQKIEAQYKKVNNIKTNQKDFSGYRTAKVKVANLDDISAIETAIKEMGFETYSMETERKSMQESAQQIQLILGILGGVSLFVAAISITNTMIMSVYERTHEIGVMKVLGCLVGNIRTIFLVEAGLIGLIGGIIGISLSYFISFLLNTFGGMLGNFLSYMPTDGTSKISVIPLWLTLLGLLFATIIGVIAGFQPANRAVKISALEAIKTE